MSVLKTGIFFMIRIKPRVTKRVTAVMIGTPMIGFIVVRLNWNPR